MFNLFSDPFQLLLFAAALIAAITIHEFSHAFLADRLGDPTPRLQGRLTLNPLAHLDILGTLMLFLVHFGWGKPVQFDPYNLRHPQRDAALISIAGPASNMLLATAVALLIRIFPEFTFYAIPFIQLNVILAIFNLIPIHPLDGGKVLIGLLEPNQARYWERFLSQYGLFILLFLIFPIFGGVPLISLFLSPLLSFFMSIFLPS